METVTKEREPYGKAVCSEAGELCCVCSSKIIYLVLKRIMDIVGSLCGILVFLIPMALIALLIKLDSRGPAFFAQERLGLNGKPFMIYKFRTMRLDAEAGGPQWAKKDDERCTRLGHFLRKTRLDELPQLYNILKGEMSLVGPRPERPYFYDVFDLYVPGFRDRLAIKPGLTGLAQVNGGYDLNPKEKLIYDMEYIMDQSLLLDVKCILKTVGLVFTHEGAR